jgi:hypothetical protein
MTIRPARSGRALLTAGIAAATAACLTVSVLAGLRAAAERGMRPTAAQRAVAAAAAVAQRWRAWPAGRIFPARLGYTTSLHTQETARRAGIAAGSGCAAAMDRAAAREALRDGCRAALRATYADELQGIVYTIGILVFARRSGAAAFLRAVATHQRGGAGQAASGGEAAAGGPRQDPAAFTAVMTAQAPLYGLRAHPVAGTAAALFGSAARQVMTRRQQGPYLALAVAGYADGRPSGATRRRRLTIFRPAGQLAAEVLAPLAAPPYVSCARPEWAC